MARHLEGSHLNLLNTLRSATFHSDDSILTAVEDQPLNSSSSSPPIDNSTSTYISVLPELSSTCNGTASLPLNCFDPVILIAIQKFNARIFKSIVFLSYEIHVMRSKPDKYDVVWSFRNIKEKSWRKG